MGDEKTAKNWYARAPTGGMNETVNCFFVVIQFTSITHTIVSLFVIKIRDLCHRTARRQIGSEPHIYIYAFYSLPAATNERRKKNKSRVKIVVHSKNMNGLPSGDYVFKVSDSDRWDSFLNGKSDSIRDPCVTVWNFRFFFLHFPSILTETTSNGFDREF